MNWWGKLTGGLAGLATGRPLLALLGVLLGHQFDRGYAKRRGSGEPPRLPSEFLRITFETLGHVAKADGRVSEAEIREARAVMHELALSADDTRSAVDWFNAGKRTGYPLRGRMQRLTGLADRSSELNRAFLRLQLRIALADGRVDDRQRAVLWTMARELGIGRVELAQMEAVLRARRGFARADRGRTERRLAERAYEVLGVPEDASDSDIKQAYRRLMNRYHPDKLASRGTDPGALAAAHERTREIRNAYDALKARRGFK